MKKSRFTDEQIIGFLKQVEAGAAVVISRHNGARSFRHIRASASTGIAVVQACRVFDPLATLVRAVAGGKRGARNESPSSTRQ